MNIDIDNCKIGVLQLLNEHKQLERNLLWHKNFLPEISSF